MKIYTIILILFIFIITFGSLIEAKNYFSSDVLYVKDVINETINLDNALCDFTITSFISSKVNYSIDLDLSGKEYFIANINGELINSSVITYSYPEKFNVSVHNVENGYKISVQNDTHLLIKPLESGYISLSFKTYTCIQNNPDLGLIRLPIRYSGDFPIEYHLSINKKMGENNNINIFLLGYPLENTTALGVLESNIVSRNPIELNFTSNYPKNKKIDGFVDLYYFQNPLLTIQQEDIVDLMNKKISRNVGAKKLVSDNLCYQTTSSGIEIFYLDDNISNNLNCSDIPDSHGGYEPVYTKNNEELNISNTPCKLGNKPGLFPFRCFDSNVVINISNYISTKENTLPIEFIYSLSYNSQDMIITKAPRCIAYSEISIPSINVIKDTNPTIPLTINLGNMLNAFCSNVSEGGIDFSDNIYWKYTTPNLIINYSSKLEDNSYEQLSFNLDMPYSSESVYITARTEDKLSPKILFLFDLIFSMLAGIWYWFIFVLRKEDKKKKNKLAKYISWIVGIIEVAFCTISSIERGITLLFFAPFMVLALSAILLFILGIFFNGFYRKIGNLIRDLKKNKE